MADDSVFLSLAIISSTVAFLVLLCSCFFFLKLLKTINQRSREIKSEILKNRDFIEGHRKSSARVKDKDCPHQGPPSWMAEETTEITPAETKLKTVPTDSEMKQTDLSIPDTPEIASKNINPKSSRPLKQRNKKEQSAPSHVAEKADGSPATPLECKENVTENEKKHVTRSVSSKTKKEKEKLLEGSGITNGTSDYTSTSKISGTESKTEQGTERNSGFDPEIKTPHNP